MMKKLKRLNLSHNRISSLQYFKETILSSVDAPNLSYVDFNDNYIGDLT